ncbi:MAG: hypothetical protein AAB421_04140 [Patescibacteria group bacterium]
MAPDAVRSYGYAIVYAALVALVIYMTRLPDGYASVVLSLMEGTDIFFTFALVGGVIFLVSIFVSGLIFAILQANPVSGHGMFVGTVAFFAITGVSVVIVTPNLGIRMWASNATDWIVVTARETIPLTTLLARGKKLDEPGRLVTTRPETICATGRRSGQRYDFSFSESSPAVVTVCAKTSMASISNLGTAKIPLNEAYGINARDAARRAMRSVLLETYTSAFPHCLTDKYPDQTTLACLQNKMDTARPAWMATAYIDSITVSVTVH